MSSQAADRIATGPGAEPFYLPLGNEIAVFRRCHAAQLAVMLKGPTGCGKTRFVEHMAWRLGRPLVTVSCHDDLSASDLIGRYLIRQDGTVWQDGPLTRAVREGAICYLDEVVEARQDTVVVLHSLSDYRRVLPIDKTGELVAAAAGFMLVISYNPGYQRMLKDLKPSTRQRFVALELDFPDDDRETTIIERENPIHRGRVSSDQPPQPTPLIQPLGEVHQHRVEKHPKQQAIAANGLRGHVRERADTGDCR